MPIDYMSPKIYNYNTLYERKLTSMEKIITDKIISDIEEIKCNSDLLAGLSYILTVFFETTYGSEDVIRVFSYLMEEAYKMQDKCNSLLKLTTDK